jgi:hypothetical protein
MESLETRGALRHFAVSIIGTFAGWVVTFAGIADATLHLHFPSSFFPASSNVLVTVPHSFPFASLSACEQQLRVKVGDEKRPLTAVASSGSFGTPHKRVTD